MTERIGLLEQRFGRLVVLRDAGRNRHGKALWECICDCGQTKIIAAQSLKSGATKSCGCLIREVAANNTHPEAEKRNRTRKCWDAMLRRCLDSHHPAWQWYGQKGVRVVDRWNPREGGSFENFVADMGYAPEGMALDKDKLGDGLLYGPSTCCWLTMKEQMRYRGGPGAMKFFEFQGQSHSLDEWAEKVGMLKGTLASRLKLGWSIDKALTTPVQRREKSPG